jgi:hypothetical protein
MNIILQIFRAVVSDTQWALFCDALGLADLNVATPESEEALINKLLQQLPAQAAGPAVKKAVGRLVVLEQGIVDLPVGAVVTFLGKDKAVTHDPDGSSVTYYVDGRVERRERFEKQGPSAPTGPGPP